MIEWNDSFSVGVSKMDAQHKVLLSQVNELCSAVLDNRSSDVLGKILNMLAAYTVSHFKAEEQWMAQNCTQDFIDRELPKHIAIHEKLLTQVGAYMEQFKKGEIVGAAVLNFLTDWLLTHIAEEDMLYNPKKQS